MNVKKIPINEKRLKTEEGQPLSFQNNGLKIK